MTFQIPIPELPDFPDIIIPAASIPPPDIILPPICLCTYGIPCKVCGEIIHGSRCSESWEEFQAWIEAHPKLCDTCTATEN